MKETVVEVSMWGKPIGLLSWNSDLDVAVLTKLDDSERFRSLYINELTELAIQALNDREGFQARIKETDQGVREILKIGTSAGGAKPKAIIAYNEKIGDVRSGQVVASKGYGYWLIKFDGVAEQQKIRENPKGIGAVEYAYYLMAVDCEITMMESRLMNDGTNRHFMTRRFDRTETGEKLHTQTLAAIAHFDRDLPHSYEEAFSVMRLMGLGINEQTEFFRRMVFNILARNQDDHTKNHSFVMNKTGEWHLAPAYDLCYNYSPGIRWISVHQMSLNGKREGFVREDLLAVGGRMEIPEAPRVIEQVSEVVARWKAYAQQAGVLQEHIQLIEKNLLSFY